MELYDRFVYLLVKGSLVRNFRSYEQLDSLSSGSSQ